MGVLNVIRLNEGSSALRRRGRNFTSRPSASRCENSPLEAENRVVEKWLEEAGMESGPVLAVAVICGECRGAMDGGDSLAPGEVVGAAGDGAWAGKMGMGRRAVRPPAKEARTKLNSGKT